MHCPIIISALVLIHSISLRNESDITRSDAFVTLWAGTVVSLELAEAIDGSNVSVGMELSFRVRSNVVVNGQIVIVTGAMATGKIKKIRRQCDSFCADISVAVSMVQAVDGQQVFLRSTPHQLKVDCCRGDGKIRVGAKVSANTLNDAKINV